MALFKALVGDSSRISTDVTPYHEGYVYLTPDDGGFYVDAMVDDEESRIRINPKSDRIELTLKATDWSAKQQALSLSKITANGNGWLSLPANATPEQEEAAANAELYVASQVDGFLILVARGTTPTIDIPIVIILLP